MGFPERLLRRRRPTLDDVPGFAGGNLGEQLDVNAPFGGQQAQPPQTAISRPRQVTRETLPDNGIPTANGDVAGTPVASGFQDRLMRQVTPRDPIADQAESLRDLESKPLSLRDKAGLVAQNIATNLGGKPLATRRQRAIGMAENALGRDLAVQKEQAGMQNLKGQQDAREAAILRGQQGIDLREQGLKQAADRTNQMATLARKRNIASIYNGQREFDPDDPKNATFVAEFEKEHGFKPPKKVSGSLLTVVEGQNTDGSPSFTVIDKGTQTASQVQGDLPVQTARQVGEQGRERRFDTSQANANTRAATVEAGKTARAAGRTGGVGGGGQSPAQSASELRQANALAAKYNYARKLEMSPQTPKEKKGQLQAGREALWNQIFATYPGMFEADDNGELRMKAQGVASTQTTTPTADTHGFSIKGWLSRNPGKTEADARAFHDGDEKYRSYKIIP